MLFPDISAVGYRTSKTTFPLYQLNATESKLKETQIQDLTSLGKLSNLRASISLPEV